MKKKMNSNIISVIVLIFIFSVNVWAGFNYITRKCRFKKGGGERIYTIACERNCSTSFVLPEGELVSQVIEPTGNWRINSDGKRFVYVVPDSIGLHTSIDIITKNSSIYSFILREVSQIRKELKIVKKVLILVDHGGSMIRRMDEIKDKSKEKRSFIPVINLNYKVKGRAFKTGRIYDNGRFTYIEIKNSGVRPVLFLRKGRGKRNPEIVRYTDDGIVYTVHRILDHDERFVLKAGKKEISIRRSKKR